MADKKRKKKSSKPKKAKEVLSPEKAAIEIAVLLRPKYNSVEDVVKDNPHLRKGFEKIDVKTQRPKTSGSGSAMLDRNW